MDCHVAIRSPTDGTYRAKARMVRLMLSVRQRDTVLLRSPAKVNLFLEVLKRRLDGFHDLASLMITVDLFDTLELKEELTRDLNLSIVSLPHVKVGNDLPTLPSGNDNLILRAAELLRQRTGHSGGASMRLFKRIPLAAGLAGGSSNAAATLLGLNRLWRTGLSVAELSQLGAELGSDVSFFFSTPAAWCTGRGEIIRPVEVGRPFWIVLVCPPMGSSTAQVFKNLSVPEQPQEGESLLEAFTNGDLTGLQHRLFNRLESTAIQLTSELEEVKQRLMSIKPVGSLMSGSGSTFFSLCKNRAEAEHVAQQLNKESWTTGIKPRIHISRITV